VAKPHYKKLAKNCLRPVATKKSYHSEAVRKKGVKKKYSVAKPHTKNKMTKKKDKK